jgi:DNA-binding response OmpR family regulator
MYSKKFEIKGFEVSSAKDGEEGYTVAQSAKPDIILTDLMMPRLDGFGLLKKLKADDELKSVPVIMLTNVGGSDEDKNKGLELGAKDYLVKTQNTPNQIVEKVEKLIG